MLFNFKQAPPLTLYIHIPWCEKKCPYCDFNSHVSQLQIPETEYIEALIADLENALPDIWGREINSIFFGGGTPSLFSPESIDQLLSALRARLNFAPNIEITLEANPGTVEQRKFDELFSIGVNRLSIGVQSFQASLLTRIGRIHNDKEAIKAVEAAHKAGFTNFNIDLMFGLPDQSQQQAIDDIQTAISLEPSHISHYQLTLEPDTAFYYQPPKLPADDNIILMQDICQAALAKANYNHYEVSAYSKPDKQCIHNLNYWTFGDYLGIGAGAHSKITLIAEQTINRYWKVKKPLDYIKKTKTREHIEGTTTLNRKDATFEFMLNALRLTHGFPTTLLFEHTGLPISCIEKVLETAVSKDLIRWDVQTICPTEKGQRFLNDLVSLFIEE